MNDRDQCGDKDCRTYQSADNHLNGSELHHVFIVVLAFAYAQKTPKHGFGDLQKGGALSVR